MKFLKWFFQSNTMVIGVLEAAVGTGIAILTGDITAKVGTVMIATGILQVVQRAIKRYKEEHKEEVE